MLRKIEYLIPAALEAIDATFRTDIQGNGIPSGYQSAASGFGTTLLQMGLLPTLAVYVDEGSDADIDRKKLLATLQAILAHPDSRFGQKGLLGRQNSLLKDVLQPGFPQADFKEHLLQASLAFKLAIRTYKLKKS
ncbi:MAG: type III-B CRISPR module-associated protein Cmr5 [Saprospiraceae bacterium]|nr:type III-B CRISPR module-associated protein Cmr5 [Saprospiraceae bacterium]MDZ4705763.1 type III-B CRISPR module-associated protein Cmr5 [Saprospiraceae bacterium]